MTAASPQPSTGIPPGAAGRPQRWRMLVVLCLSLLIVGLDVTVLNVALPALIGELRASTGELQWLVDIYSLMAAGLMLSAGSLAVRYGSGRSSSPAWSSSPVPPPSPRSPAARPSS
ncbi:hypothetical protein ACFVXC_42115 [Streptomyces sp. NPDC058257]|uniref:hypothetical protein n=1 Tax=Streptomyces sp. NPDC058257 TaxID=3346409 RepID=UPI0036ED6998